MADDSGSWSRAFMASSGISVAGADAPRREKSAQWHEAVSVALTRDRLKELSVSKSVAIREAIAARSDCPLGILASYAHDHRPSVRVAVAANPRTARALFEHLIKDRDSNVTKAVARNPAVPQDLIERLAVHKREDVRRVALRHLAARATGTISDEAEQLQPEAPLPVQLHDRPSLAHLKWGDAAQPREGAPWAATEATAEDAQPLPVRQHRPAMLAPKPTVGRVSAEDRPSEPRTRRPPPPGNFAPVQG